MSQTKGDFYKQIKELIDFRNSKKLENLKEVIATRFSQGVEQVIIDYPNYDNVCITWLRSQGFDVVETCSQRDGDFITIKM